ncbi:BgTH12-05862 [Blumeria graminis f. sp. triticale]|uniref:Vezatin n=4 Tax=Blumeria graminis TaxID=34373 RepID=A0A656KFE2_BLUGR|nr:hypothetical protein BGT96224_A21306 [Blumeria graminis f. sp. tritici 96224]CAD6504125.1 BgTH12-05862 [Blumeria graminis f. sp. triticale]VDB90894.1 BgtA-21306 [Blumeria graminis f. sp. tritici]
MEGVVLEDTPLAAYLEGKGQEDHSEDTTPANLLPNPSFAPKGRLNTYKLRYKVPPPLWREVPQHRVVEILQDFYSRALDSRLSQADNARFLERFRYLIVASQLLNLHTYPSSSDSLRTSYAQEGDNLQLQAFSPTGAAFTALSAFSLAWLIHWARNSARSAAGRGRLAVMLTVLGIAGMISYAYFRRQWLQNLRQETVTELSNLIVSAYELDRAAANAISLVQEVELVSRGYRISSPLPPISRIEDRGQSRRCIRLRKLIRTSFVEVTTKYVEAVSQLQPLAEELDLEKYYDIYDITENDLSEASLGYPETEAEDQESVRTLKLLAARYNTLRRIFLCCLMALNADGNKNDFHVWKIALERIRDIRVATASAGARLASLLNAEESFPVPPTPKLPLTPGRERWRAQSRQLNSLSTGIRGLQAKLQVLREESDRNLNKADGLSEFNNSLLTQYESLGTDLRALMQEWEEGKSALAANIDRNERRFSTLSGMISPTASLGGLTVVEEGSALEALQVLNGGTRPRSSTEISSMDFEEVFEATAIPRKRITLSREERIARLKEDRAKRNSVRTSQDANTKMLRELESVIKMRPKTVSSKSGRISSI